MVCLEISLNGNVICTAGLEEGQVSAHILSPEGAHRSEGRLFVHGATSRPPAFAGPDVAPVLLEAMQRSFKISSVLWLEGQLVKVGDELTIRVVDRADSDPPKSVRPVAL